jgi:hypothetical protein
VSAPIPAIRGIEIERLNSTDIVEKVPFSATRLLAAGFITAAH